MFFIIKSLWLQLRDRIISRPDKWAALNSIYLLNHFFLKLAKIGKSFDIVLFFLSKCTEITESI